MILQMIKVGRQTYIGIRYVNTFCRFYGQSLHLRSFQVHNIEILSLDGILKLPLRLDLKQC